MLRDNLNQIRNECIISRLETKNKEFYKDIIQQLYSAAKNENRFVSLPSLPEAITIMDLETWCALNGLAFVVGPCQYNICF